MKEIDLNYDNLIELTEDNLKALCHLNNIKPNELKRLDLSNNNLKNINFIQSNTSFINLRILFLSNNPITDIDNIKYLENLEILDISYLKFKNLKDTINVLKTLNKLNKIYYYYNTFENYKLLCKTFPNIEIIF